MRFLIIIPLVLLILYYISCIAYITEGKGRKEGDLFDSDDGTSLFAALLFMFVLFPFIVRPLMLVKGLFRGFSFDLKFIPNTFGWCFKSFKKIFTLNVKVTKELLKK